MADAGPSAQSVGREFVRQYYTMLNERPDCLHRSEFIGSFWCQAKLGLNLSDLSLPYLSKQSFCLHLELVNSDVITFYVALTDLSPVLTL